MTAPPLWKQQPPTGPSRTRAVRSRVLQAGTALRSAATRPSRSTPDVQRTTTRPAPAAVARPIPTGDTPPDTSSVTTSTLLWEFFGSFVLGLVGLWTAVNLTLLGTPSSLKVAFAFGFALVILGYGGGDHNPYLTIAGLFDKSRTFKEALRLIAVQFLGFGLAVYVIYHVYRDDARIKALFGAAVPAPSSTWQLVAFGAFASVFAFVVAVKLITSDPDHKPATGLVAGLALGGLIYVTTSWSGGGVNLAREWMPLIMAQFELPYLLNWDTLPAEFLRWPSGSNIKGAFDTLLSQWLITAGGLAGAVAGGLFSNKVFK